MVRVHITYIECANTIKILKSNVEEGRMLVPDRLVGGVG